MAQVKEQIQTHDIMARKGCHVDASITKSPSKPRARAAYEVVSDQEEWGDEPDTQAAMQVTQPGVDDGVRWVSSCGKPVLIFRRRGVKVSVIIKALNEERNIVCAIESALEAVDKVGEGEVILADSFSTDQTVELARRYPLRIVQLVDPRDRCCGVGAEIGYRIAQGEYIYILDADMELDGDFLVAAVAALDADSSLAGVGGVIKDLYVANAEFRRRTENVIVQFGEIDCLNGGGLYRKSAVEQVEYLTNRNLHSYEEYELGLRLRALGWRLQRLNIQAINHYGHTDTSFRLLWRRWCGRYAWGAGELLREAWGKPYLREALRGVIQYRLSLIVGVWWLSLLLSTIGGFYHPSGWWLLIILLLIPLLFGVFRRKSLVDGLYMVVSQNLHTAGVIMGFFSARRGDPTQAPEFRTIK